MKTVVHRSDINCSKIYQKGNWKNIRFPLKWKKRPPRHPFQLFFSRGKLGILDIDTQLNS